MSNTPLVKTSGRGSACRRAASWSRGQSLERKAGEEEASMRLDCEWLDWPQLSPRRFHRESPWRPDAQTVRIPDLQLSQQSETCLAGKRHSLRGDDVGRRHQRG